MTAVQFCNVTDLAAAASCSRNGCGPCRQLIHAPTRLAADCPGSSEHTSLPRSATHHGVEAIDFKLGDPAP
jgi:hypothetical protein